MTHSNTNPRPGQYLTRQPWTAVSTLLGLISMASYTVGWRSSVSLALLLLNIWLTIAKNAFVGWALNFRVRMLLKGAVRWRGSSLCKWTWILLVCSQTFPFSTKDIVTGTRACLRVKKNQRETEESRSHAPRSLSSARSLPSKKQKCQNLSDWMKFSY